jgi:uncharacterized protein (TIGR02145 family)
MAKKHLILCLALLAGAALAVSCKKDKEDIEYKYVYGRVEFGDMPAYVTAGQAFDFIARGGYTEDGTPVKYSWSCNPFYTSTAIEKDASGDWKFHFEVPSDTLCTFTLTVTASADTEIKKGISWISTSGSLTTTIVDPDPVNGSLSGITVPDGAPSYTDPRDGKAYPLTETAGLQWFRRNLAWEGAGKPHSECAAMKDIYGIYYTWTEAQTACPAGWRVPSDADWRELAAGWSSDPGAGFKQFEGLAGAMMADAYFNGDKLWEFWPGVTISNKSGFSAIPGSFASIENGKYRFNGGKYALWWTSDEQNGLGVCRYLHEESDIVFCQGLDKNLIAAPVRCVRNK